MALDQQAQLDAAGRIQVRVQHARELRLQVPSVGSIATSWKKSRA